VSTVGSHATAFAPAGVGNIGVGFDVLGHALECNGEDGLPLGDTVKATVTDSGLVRITALTGLPLPLPTEAADNTAGRAVLAYLKHIKLSVGFDLEINKGIPLGSGLGGSAASAVAAVVAANAALDSPLSLAELYPFALEGECASTGAKHGDNVGPQLLGGVCFTTATRCIRLKVPDGLTAVVVHPDFVLETKLARAALQVPYNIGEFVQQSSYLAGFVIALQSGDLSLLRESLVDALVEPRRAPLIPGFADVKQAALDQGAIGSSISGAGPSVFAWFENAEQAKRAGEDMVRTFATNGLHARAYVSSLAACGARVLD
jgi:homoserine kinase